MPSFLSASELFRETDPDIYFYLGSWTDTRFNEILRGRFDAQSSFLGTVGLRYDFGTVISYLTREIEFNYTQHFGDQYHPELNAAFNLRWNRFPWHNYLPTSLAYGIGPSLALGTPRVEDEDDPANILLYMVAEIAFDLPGRWREHDVEGLIRVHHRSGVFGLVSDASGSNFIALGIRFPLGNIYDRNRENASGTRTSPTSQSLATRETGRRSLHRSPRF